MQSFCKLQIVFRSTCSVPANSKRFFAAFAAFLQRPKSFSEHLQHSCRGQKVFRGICSIPAEVKKFFAAFAAFLQRPKSFSWHLQHSCNHFQKLFSCRVAFGDALYWPFSYIELRGAPVYSPLCVWPLLTDGKLWRAMVFDTASLTEKHFVWH